MVTVYLHPKDVTELEIVRTDQTNWDALVGIILSLILLLTVVLDIVVLI